jgi:uncharacterized DUF497 family protein
MLIEFDPAKDERNIAECGLSFVRAAEFDFSSAIVAVDERKAYPEVRYVRCRLSWPAFAHALLHSYRRWHSCYQLSQGEQPGGQGI